MVEEKSERSTAKPLLVLSVAVLLLTLTCVAFVVAGAVVMTKYGDSSESVEDTICAPCEKCDLTSGCEEAPLEEVYAPREFYVQLPRNEFGTIIPVHQYVYVDEQQQTEAILFKDPDNKHMQNMVYVDHKHDYQIVYSSETAQCLFVPRIEKNFNENLRFLWSNKNKNVSAPTIRNEYTYDKMVGSMDDIPPMMRAFCSVSNSQWLIGAKNHVWGPEMRNQVCICSYFECVCTRCASQFCWGRCCDGNTLA